jgi:uncharacterized membrane protein
VTAKVIDSGIPDYRLEQIGEGLKPGTSAIVGIIELRWVEEVEKQLAESGADVLTEALRDDIAQQLEAGKDVAYTAVSAEGAVAAERVTLGEDEAQDTQTGDEPPAEEAGDAESKE